MQWEEKGPGKLKYSEKDFKVCDLCGALNRVENNECFVCGWYGTFHTDPATVKRVMDEFEREYGGISESLVAEELLPDHSYGSSWFSILIDKIKSFFGG